MYPGTPRIPQQAPNWKDSPCRNARRIGNCEETDIERSVVCDEISYATKDNMLSRRKLKETLCFLFVLFVISVNIRLILCSRFIAKNVLQVTSELYTEIHFQGLD